MKNPILVSAGVLLVMALGAGPVRGQSDEDLISCAAEVTWLNCAGGIQMTGEAGRATVLHLLGQVSNDPRNMCLPADLHVSVAYLDVRGTILCVGTLEDLASLDRNVQDVSIELNPAVLQNFGRWLNEPGRQAAPAFTPLGCRSPDGRGQLLDSHLGQATALSVTATLLPRTGGLGTSECRLRLVR